MKSRQIYQGALYGGFAVAIVFFTPEPYKRYAPVAFALLALGCLAALHKRLKPKFKHPRDAMIGTSLLSVVLAMLGSTLVIPRSWLWLGLLAAVVVWFTGLWFLNRALTRTMPS